MKHKKITGILMGAAAALFSVMLCITAYAGSAEVKNQGNKDYKAVRLTPEIYAGAKCDLSDMLITDTNGNAVPYFINTAEDSFTLNYDYYMLSLYDSFEKDGNRSYDFYADIPDNSTDIAASSIRFITGDSTFAVFTDISGSYDGMKWNYIKSDKLYNVDGNLKLDITFDRDEKYTMYRLTVKGNTDLRFGGAELLYDKSLTTRVYFIEELNPSFTVEEAGKNTVIKITGADNLKIDKISIDTQSLFKRETVCGGKSKIMYNLSFFNAGYSASDLSIAMEGKSFVDTIELTIENGDDKPIEVNSVAISYYADELVFKATGADGYIISFDAGRTGAAPSYDIAGYKGLILKDGYDLLPVLRVDNTLGSNEEDITKTDYSLIFNIVIVMVALLLGVIIFLRLRGAKAR